MNSVHTLIKLDSNVENWTITAEYEIHNRTNRITSILPIQPWIKGLNVTHRTLYNIPVNRLITVLRTKRKVVCFIFVCRQIYVTAYESSKCWSTIRGHFPMRGRWGNRRLFTIKNGPWWIDINHAALCVCAIEHTAYRLIQSHPKTGMTIFISFEIQRVTCRLYLMMSIQYIWMYYIVGCSRM